mmetsp:Transcript_31844/g.83232  ORF Transcript_31844/g.83232 Transcript_31844/m.83232 type:complete len:217 (+) Transcript_31844:2716-3366(+)
MTLRMTLSRTAVTSASTFIAARSSRSAWRSLSASCFALSLASSLAKRAASLAWRSCSLASSLAWRAASMASALQLDTTCLMSWSMIAASSFCMPLISACSARLRACSCATCSRRAAFSRRLSSATSSASGLRRTRFSAAENCSRCCKSWQLVCESGTLKRHNSLLGCVALRNSCRTLSSMRRSGAFCLTCANRVHCSQCHSPAGTFSRGGRAQKVC